MGTVGLCGNQKRDLSGRCMEHNGKVVTKLRDFSCAKSESIDAPMDRDSADSQPKTNVTKHRMDVT